MILWSDKETINTPLNPDNYFGEHTTSMVPMLLFFAGAGGSLLIWLLLLMPFLPFKWFLIPWLLGCGRWGLITLGQEKKKMANYLQQRADAYKMIDEIVHVQQLHEDGLIEYSNGMVAYVLTGFPRGYLNVKKFSSDLEAFMNELDLWDWDWMLHNAIDEILTENELPKLKEYKDREVTKDRIDYFAYQDDYARSHSGLYRYVFVVYATKDGWKKLRHYLESLVSSEVAKCFNVMELCGKEQVNDLINRDICTYADFIKMLTSKYENSNFNGSKVLWYDSKIPKRYKKKDDNISDTIEERRIMEDDK